MVYLIHFDEKYHHAQHYIGFVDREDRLESRIQYHRNGRGSKFLKAVSQASIGFKVVKVWKDGDRNFERKLKNRKNSPALCPICNPNQKDFLEKEWEPRRESNDS